MILQVVQSAIRNAIIAYDLILNRGLLMWLNGLILAGNSTGLASQILLILATLWTTLYTHLQRKRNSQEKNEADDVAELEKQVQLAAAEEERTEDETNKPNKEDGRKVKSRKPIWDLLPPHQQILPPWVLNEFIQLMTALWRSWYREMDRDSFDVFVRTLCGAAAHVHESKVLIAACQHQHTNNVRFVAPSRLLSYAFLRQLVDASSRFHSQLPDLTEHLEFVKSHKEPRKDDPTVLTDKWMRSYENMERLSESGSPVESENRRHMHTLVSLAECGV